MVVSILWLTIGICIGWSVCSLMVVNKIAGYEDEIAILDAELKALSEAYDDLKAKSIAAE